jgi:hypothetical protein
MGKVGGFGLGMATGGAGFLARGTLGRAAAVARDSKWVTNNQDSFIGRRAYNLTNSMANSTFDARNSDVVAGGMKKAGLDSGLLGMGGMSIGSKRTFQGQADKRKKEILDGASRIKTRYERDVYGKDAEGKKILLHKEGDIDTDAEAALKRYNQNIGGGSLFMTKKDKELAAEELAKQATANNQKAKDEQGKLSSENLTAYNSVKKDKEKREAFVSNLKTELASLDKTDPERRGNKSEAVLKTLKEVEKTDKEDKEAFDKNVANVLYAYQKKTGADKDRYLTDQTQEIQEAVRALTQPPTSTTLPQSIQRAAPAARTTSVDIDLTEKSPQTIREEKQKVATDVARTEMKMNDPNRTEAVSSSQSPEIRTPQEVTQKVTSATPLSQTTQDISTTSSAERFAQRRKERLESAQVKAQTEMSKPLETV